MKKFSAYSVLKSNLHLKLHLLTQKGYNILHKVIPATVLMFTLTVYFLVYLSIFSIKLIAFIFILYIYFVFAVINIDMFIDSILTCRNTKIFLFQLHIEYFPIKKKIKY